MYACIIYHHFHQVNQIDAVINLTAMRYLALSIDDVEGIELLRWEDQQKIRKYVEGGGPSTPDTSAVPTAQYGIEVSQTSRATCKHCSQKIMKGEVVC